MQIGFIGIGQMGAGMAANLLGAGHQVSVYNRTAAKLASLVAAGATAAASIAAACAGEAVMTMVSNDAALESVAFGADGIIASLPRGALHIGSSTISVALAERLAAAHAEAGQRFVAAPVFGAPDAAKAGTLHIVAGGAPDAVAAARPVLEAVGQSLFVVAEAPAVASLVKLSGNFLFASVIESLGEAAALVGKAGVDRRKYLDFLTATIFNVPVYKSYGGRIVDDRFESPSFLASLGQKDIRLVLAAAEALNVPMPLASLLRDRFLTLMAHGGADLDWTAIGQLAAKDAGNA